MTRILSFVLCVCILFILTACNTNNDYSNNTTNSTDFDSYISENNWYENIELTRMIHCTQNVIENDGCFYYTTKEGLNRYIVNSKVNEEILCEAIQSFAIDENKLYYLTNDEILKYYDLKLNTSHHMWDMAGLPDYEIVVEYGGVGQLCLDGGYLYVFRTNGMSAIRISLITGDSEILTDGYYLIEVSGNDCYYIDRFSRTFSIYHMDCTTKEVSLLRGDGLYHQYPPIEGKIYISDLAKVGDSIYYLMREEDQIYKLNPGGEDELIADFSENTNDVSLSIFKGAGDSLYYSVREGQNESLYEYNSDGTKFLLKVDGKTNFGDFVVTESAIFYKIADGSPVICVPR